jgi:Aldehyde oxidase and xanthine dehydrogenase, a/b hammerhead domain
MTSAHVVSPPDSPGTAPAAAGGPEGAVGPAGAGRYAGGRVRRVEDARLLTGTGTFVDDVTRPGMLHACFVRSPHPRARIIGIDSGAARLQGPAGGRPPGPADGRPEGA